MKIGIISSGRIVGEFLDQLPHMPFLEVTDMCVRPGSRQHARELLDSHGLQSARLYTQRDEFLKEGNFDFVYIASTNQAHYPQALEALNAGRNVILEKPFTVTHSQAKHLFDTAFSNSLWLFEAITTPYTPGFAFLQEQLGKIGKIRSVISSYSKRSSRYGDFLADRYTTSFDPQCAGGSIMDIGVYSIYMAAGLLGRPEEVMYIPNMQKGIDTSGTAVWKYGDFTATLSMAKDSSAPCFFIVQGDGGYIMMDGTPNECSDVKMVPLEGNTSSLVSSQHRMVWEFTAFERMWSQGDMEGCVKASKLSLTVMELLEKTRDSRGSFYRV